MAAAVMGHDVDQDLKATEETTTSDSQSGDILLTKRWDEGMVDMAGGLLVSSKPTAGADGHGMKRKEATGASSEAGYYRHHRAPKRKEASASESEDDAAAVKKKKKEEKEDGDSLFKEGEMLKLREELREAELLWRDGLVPGALDRWLLERKNTTQVPPAVAGEKKKKRKVVRVITPDAYIEYIMENPCMMRELSDEEMAKCPEVSRQTNAINKVINAKKLAYQQALIAQYRAFGFAYDEKEITDEDDEEAVVKN